MVLCTVHFRSESIRKQDGINVLIPDIGKGPFAVLYLLHGHSDDYTIWSRRTSLERYAQGRKLIIVMPDGHLSYYVNDPRTGGCAYEDHIVKDVVGFVDRVFPTIRSRRARALAGLSMGAYGAMMLGMRHPETFSVLSSHSAPFDFAHRDRPERPGLSALTSALPKGKYDCFTLARKLKEARRRLAIRFDCGTEDFLLESNRAFHKHLTKLGIKHEYAENPGEHNWTYWDEHIQETLDFVTENLAKR